MSALKPAARERGGRAATRRRRDVRSPGPSPAAGLGAAALQAGGDAKVGFGKGLKFAGGGSLGLASPGLIDAKLKQGGGKKKVAAKGKKKGFGGSAKSKKGFGK